LTCFRYVETNLWFTTAPNYGKSHILEREPNNSAALQNLVKIRLGLQDYQGAVAPLEKLVELYPKEAIFLQLLTEVQQRIQEQKESVNQSPKDSSPSNKTKPQTSN
jgi:tetratricopeptide (TPR) repeat protein